MGQAEVIGVVLCLSLSVRYKRGVSGGKIVNPHYPCDDNKGLTENGWYVSLSGLLSPMSSIPWFTLSHPKEDPLNNLDRSR